MDEYIKILIEKSEQLSPNDFSVWGANFFTGNANYKEHLKTSIRGHEYYIGIFHGIYYKMTEV